MTYEQYLNRTEYAVKQLFDSLSHYQDLISESISPIITAEELDLEQGFESEELSQSFNDFFDKNPEIKKQQELSRSKFREYMNKNPAHAIICGSILQVAHMGISKFSNYKGQCVVPVKNKSCKFCIGRLIKGVPIGLVIYAGRNQYNHWDESPHELTKGVFNILATSNNTTDYKDPAFNIDLANIDVYSHNILSLLGWNSYNDYKNDMLTISNDFDKQ